MNQVQVKYARTRAEEIRQAKLTKLIADNTVKAIVLTPAQRFKALEEGRFTIDPTIYGAQYNWASAVIFADEVKGSVDKDAIAAGRAKINAAFTKLMDELVLGDNEEALKLLAAFEAI